MCENRERRKSIVNENAIAQDIENKCTLSEQKVDGGGGTSSHLDSVGGGGPFAKETFTTCRGGGEGGASP